MTDIIKCHIIQTFKALNLRPKSCVKILCYFKHLVQLNQFSISSHFMQYKFSLNVGLETIIKRDINLEVIIIII